MEHYSFEHEFTISEKELKGRAIEFVKHQYAFFVNGKQIDCGPLIFNEKLHISINFQSNAAIFKSFQGKIGFFNKSAKFHKYPHFMRDFSQKALIQEICEMSDILNPEKTFIENQQFTLQIKGFIFLDSTYHMSRIFSPTLGHFLWERDDRDFVISVGKNGETKAEIKIHKLVLASRSSVFDAMLKAEMKEKVENRIEIVDFDVKVVRKAVQFFYDQEIYRNISLDTLIGLLQFSDKYDIKDLKKKTENELFDHLNPANICQISNASIISNSQMLKDICLSSMVVFQRHVENLEILDKDFAFELLHKTFSSGL